MVRTDSVSIYKPNFVLLADLNSVPSAATIVETGVSCNIHRDTQQAKDDAITIGIVANQVAHIFFDPEEYTNLGDRYILVDETLGDVWLVRTRPDLRNRFSSTSHVRCLVTLLLQKPTGVA